MGSPGSAPYNFPGTEDGPRRRREGVAAVLETRREEQQRTAPAQLNVVPMTPPVEATLRILLNSVPYLIGAEIGRASCRERVYNWVRAVDGKKIFNILYFK